MSIITFKNVYISHSATMVGKLEGEGPLGSMFDLVEKDAYFGMSTWEQAESEMARRAINLLLSKAKMSDREVELILGGDLLNQCTATAFAAMTVPSPYIGLYGACSTLAEGLMVGGMFVDSGFFTNAIALASSHFCSSERQFRFPLEYGNQRPPVSQTTVTGTGAFLIRSAPAEIQLTKALPGRIREMGIIDSNNMGAAMANAATDTILRYFDESKESPGDYDIIATGDLGREGYELTTELLSKCGLDLCGKFTDCGMLIYDYNTQDVNSGGSGCGCSACVTATLFFDKLKKREAKKIIVIGTGALLSPKTVLQKQPIPAVAHLVVIERV